MYRVILCLTLIVVLFYTVSCDSGLSKQEIKIEKIEHQIDSLINYDSNFESISIGIVSPEGKIKSYRGKLLNGEKSNDQTLYEIASITKTFTGLLIAHAIVDGKITIDDGIHSYLPDEYSDISNRGIRFKDLVSHRSGLPLLFPHREALYEMPLDWDKLPFEINRMQTNFTRDKFFESLKEFELDTIPGSKTLYSNAGTNLAGYLLENIYDQSFEHLLRDKITTPLNMTNTTIRLSKVDTSILAKGFNENKLAMPYRVEKAMNAEGGMISSIDDMINYLDYHLNSNSNVVSQSQERIINDPAIPYHQGLFWHFNEDNEKPFDRYQLGGAYGTSSWIGMATELKIGVFIVSNSSGPEVHDKLEMLATEVFTILMDN